MDNWLKNLPLSNLQELHNLVRMELTFRTSQELTKEEYDFFKQFIGSHNVNYKIHLIKSLRNRLQINLIEAKKLAERLFDNYFNNRVTPAVME